jgi:hypothetical protein
MMSVDGLTIGIGAAIHLSLFVGTTVWKLSRVEKSIRADTDKALEKIATKTDTALTKIADEMRAEHDETTRNTGEALTALRSKIHEVEVWSRDNFVRRTDFMPAMDALKEAINASVTRLDAGLLRIEGKLEKMRDHG